MPTDELRDHEPPDSADEASRGDDHTAMEMQPDGGLGYAARLEAIDRIAAASVTDLKTTGAIEGEHSELVVHLEAIRTAVEAAKQTVPDAASDDEIRAVLRRGLGTTTCLGPEPAAFDRVRGDDAVDDE
ncbi:hypothetical protein D8Y22_06855 [Salinadaptatus halalkaliphilus]|uniref:Uncharacterized protein n=1 Tax=Salinadaptatus halalkaliphilus TaxID=2419781 RepID=A0A4S3TMP6_9EURY|nr:hypothetical protein [Salinadaptatus halalkaliphilus]THE65529.1 hypothetical protein D8Y22_06855 [Salinadaptatus halalkaliphilus]